MLVSVADFTGEYRLHNVNNPNTDLLQAIDENQSILARDLFSEQTANAIIANPPTVAPCLGLRAIGLDGVFLSWLSLRIQMPVVAAGVVSASDHPASNIFASGNFVKIGSYWRSFLERFRKYERVQTGTAVAANTIRIADDDPVWSQLVYPNSPAIVSGIGITNVLAVNTLTGTGTDFVLSATTLVAGQNYTIKQQAVVLQVRDFQYF